MDSLERASFLSYYSKSDRCHAFSDGDCSWGDCPQAEDYQASCPLSCSDDWHEEIDADECPTCRMQQDPLPQRREP